MASAQSDLATTNDSDQKPTSRNERLHRNWAFQMMRTRCVGHCGLQGCPLKNNAASGEHYERKQQIEFPEHTSLNPELRAERVAKNRPPSAGENH